MAGKYNAQKVELEGYTFDSKFEAQTYKLLRLHLPKHEIKCHEPVQFAPATLRFPSWEWKVDFYIPKWNWWIESKGVRTRDWVLLLRAIDQLKPEFLDRVSIVSSAYGEKVCKGLFTITHDELNQTLLQKVKR